jgi:hypothetical protein
MACAWVTAAVPQHDGVLEKPSWLADWQTCIPCKTDVPHENHRSKWLVVLQPTVVHVILPQQHPLQHWFPGHHTLHL